MNIKNIDSLSFEECKKLLAANPDDEQLQARYHYLLDKHNNELLVKEAYFKDKEIEIATKERELQSVSEKYKKRIDGLEYKLQEVAVQRNINENKLNRSNTYKYIFLATTILFFISTIFFFARYQSISNKYQSISNKYANTIHIQDVVDVPIIVTDIAMGNTSYEGEIETEYGDTIVDVNTMYLRPKITYIGANDESVSLYYKIQKPNGEVTCCDGESYYINKGKNTLILCGWGNEKPGHWEAGNYTISIWYCDKKIAEDKFVIHKSQDSE